MLLKMVSILPQHKQKDEKTWTIGDLEINFAVLAKLIEVP